MMEDNRKVTRNAGQKYTIDSSAQNMTVVHSTNIYYPACSILVQRERRCRHVVCHGALGRRGVSLPPCYPAKSNRLCRLQATDCSCSSDPMIMIMAHHYSI